ncbi:MAG: hypothetical protein WC023_01735 [Rhodocyclaceae bacterium]
MSTRWQVAAKLPDGRCGCIYVHCDGYPSAALTTLQQHYTDPQKIDRLIALGDCLSVASEIENCDPFSTRPDEVWEEIKPTYGEDPKAVADAHQHGDENYRYTWDGAQWAMEHL